MYDNELNNWLSINDKPIIGWLNGSSYLDKATIPFLSLSGLFTFLKQNTKPVSIFPKSSILNFQKVEESPINWFNYLEPLEFKENTGGVQSTMPIQYPGLSGIDAVLNKIGITNPIQDFQNKLSLSNFDENNPLKLKKPELMIDGSSTELSTSDSSDIKKTKEDKKDYTKFYNVAQKIGTYSNVLNSLVPKVKTGRAYDNIMLYGNTAFDIGMNSKIPVVQAISGIGKGALAGINLANSLTSKKAYTFNRDYDSESQIGGDYLGHVYNSSIAESNNNDKFSTIFPGSLNDANKLALDLAYKGTTFKNIADVSRLSFDRQNSMEKNNELAHLYHMNGGFNSLILRSKEGGKFKRVRKILNKYLNGGKTSRTLEELIKYSKLQNPRFIQRLSEPYKEIEFIDDKGNKTRGSHYLEWGTDDTGNAIIYPRIQENEDGKLQLYSSNDAYNKAIKNNNILKMSEDEAKIFFAPDDEFKTAYKRGWPNFFKFDSNNSVIENKEKFKDGGIIDSGSYIELIDYKNIVEFKDGGNLETSYSEIELVNPNNLPEFKEGGSINVIPEGALHARLHHIKDDENITKKGIPVVSQTEDGKIELQAEIERNEIIFRLEVTKKLEELESKYYNESVTQKEKDELAIIAGKLLVNEILHNTQDNTGILNEIKNK